MRQKQNKDLMPKKYNHREKGIRDQKDGKMDKYMKRK
jgi:hypothetical protein